MYLVSTSPLAPSESEGGDWDRVESVGVMHPIAFLVSEPGLRDHTPDDRMLTETDSPFLVLVGDLC